MTQLTRAGVECPFLQGCKALWHLGTSSHVVALAVLGDSMLSESFSKLGDSVIP